MLDSAVRGNSQTGVEPRHQQIRQVDDMRKLGEFIVRFRFARLSDRVNKRLSVVPAPFIAAQPGFRTKSWILGRDGSLFGGLYEWDSVEDAEAYWTSFPMRLLKRRAVPESLSYEINPR